MTIRTLEELTMNYSLSQSLEICSQSSFSGYLEARHPDGTNARLRFFMGHFVGDLGGKHPLRRWFRHTRHVLGHGNSSHVKTPACQDWNYICLEPLLRLRKISHDEMTSILEGSAKEVILKMACMERTYLARDRIQPDNLEGTGFIIRSEKLSAFGTAPLVSLDVRPFLPSIKRQVDFAFDANLLRVCHYLAPVIHDLDKLVASSSPTTVARLEQLLNGENTILDLAILLQKPPVLVAKSLAPHIADGSIVLREVEDIAPLPSSVIYTSELARKTNSLTKLLVQEQEGLAYAKILYIDDSKAVTALLHNMIRGTEHDLRTLNNPIVALPTCLEYKPDIVILDLVMPVANGYEICTQLRRVTRFKELPIVILTNNDGAIDRIRSKIAGASIFVSKPLTRDKVCRILEKYNFAPLA